MMTVRDDVDAGKRFPNGEDSAMKPGQDERRGGSQPSHPALPATLLMVGVALAIVLIAAAGAMR